jgi:hypothetical protein
VIVETLTAIVMSAAFQAEHSQKERCAHNQASGAMMCVNRIGHCMSLSVDGQKTVALTDEATARRVHAIKHDQDVCWQLTQPVSTKLRVVAGNGGIFPNYIGNIEKVDANVYQLADFDPKVDSRLDQVEGIRMVADGDPNGTWHLTSEHALPAGEYVVTFRVFGVNNWDKQAVLLKLDPALAPAPAGGK